MDHSIMKLLEEDEDETMHSGADVEAFTAALNRDIEGDSFASLLSDSPIALSQGINHTKGLLKQEQQSSVREQQQHGSSSENQPAKNDSLQDLSLPPSQQKQFQDNFQKQQAERNSLQMCLTTSVLSTEKTSGHHQESDRTRNPDGESQYQRLQRMNNQQAMATGRATSTIIRGVSFGLLLPIIEPQLDQDRAMQLQALYVELKTNKIPREAFYQRVKSFVGDQILKMAVYKLLGQLRATRNSPNAANQFPLPAKTSAQHLQIATANSSHIPSPAAQFSADSSNMAMDNDAQASRGVDHRSDSHDNNTSAQSRKPQPLDLQMRQVPGHPCIGANQIGTTTQAMNQMIVPKVERHNSLSDVKRVQGGTLTLLTNNLASQHSTGLRQASFYKEQNHLSYVKQEPIDQTIEQPQNSQFSTSQGLSSFPPGQLEQGNVISGTSKDESYESSRMGFSISNSESLSIIALLKPERHNPPLSIPAQMECERHNPPQFITSQVERECHNPSLSIPAQLERERHTPPLSITAQLEQERQNSQLNSQIPSTTSPLGLGSSGKRTPLKPLIGQKKPLEALGSSQPLSSKKQKLSGALSDQIIKQLNDVTAVSGVNLREEGEQLFSGFKEESRASEASRRVVQEEEERLILQKIPLQKKLAEIMEKCVVRGISNDVERCLSLCVEERIRGLIGNLIRLSKQRVDLEKPRHHTVVASDIREQIMTMKQKAQEEWEKKQADGEKLLRTDEPEDDTGADGDKEKDEGRGKSSKANKDEDDKMRTRAANVAARAAMGGDDMMSKWQLMAEQAWLKNRDSASKRIPSPVVYTPGTVRKIRKSQDASPNKIARSISVKDVISVLEREPQMSKTTIIYSLYENMRSDDIVD